MLCRMHLILSSECESQLSLSNKQEAYIPSEWPSLHQNLFTRILRHVDRSEDQFYTSCALWVPIVRHCTEEKSNSISCSGLIQALTSVLVGSHSLPALLSRIFGLLAPSLSVAAGSLHEKSGTPYRSSSEHFPRASAVGRRSTASTPSTS